MATTAQILNIVRYVELAKQLKPALTEQQEAVLVEQLLALNESNQKIKHRAESVVLKETYGTIAFQYWVQDEVGLRSEINEEMYRLHCAYRRQQESFEADVQRAIFFRIEELRRNNTKQETERYVGEMELVLLEAERLKIRAERKQLVEQKRKQIAEKFKNCKLWLHSLSLPARRKLLAKAVRRKYLKLAGQTEVDYIEYYADLLMPLYEEVLARGKDK